MKARTYLGTADKLHARGRLTRADAAQIRSNVKLAGKYNAEAGCFRDLAGELSGELDAVAAGPLDPRLDASLTAGKLEASPAE